MAQVPGIVEETRLVQKDEASHGGGRKKLTSWQWLSSSGRMGESSVALRQKLEQVAMRRAIRISLVNCRTEIFLP